MALEMRTHCERCNEELPLESNAFICSYECTFCELCAGATQTVCPNCGGELMQRPKRK